MKEADFFICYCKTEKQIAEYIFLKLNSLGFSVWFDNNEILLSDNIEEEIFKGLQNSKYTICLLSSNFLLNKWTMKEIEIALNREQLSNIDNVLPFLIDIDYSSIIKELPVLESRAFENLEKFDYKKNDVWLAKLILRFFNNECELELLKTHNIIPKENIDILNTLINHYQDCSVDLRASIVNLYNIGGFTCYLCNKYGILIDRATRSAYLYLKMCLSFAYKHEYDVSIFHLIACVRATVFMLSFLSSYSDNHL
jgi:TIR domain.